jgi:hypothetical protein
MALSQKHRNMIYAAWVPTFGEEVTEAMVSALTAPIPEDVATKELVRTEVAALRSDVQVEIAEVRVEMHQGFSEIRSEMHMGISELRSEMHQGFSEIRKEMGDRFHSMTLWTAGTVLGGVISSGALTATIVSVLS